MNLEHLLHALTNHPDIQSATFGPAPNGLLDWDVITITFTDDTLQLLNVNVAQPTYPGETEAECVERVLKLVFNSEAETVVGVIAHGYPTAGAQRRLLRRPETGIT